MESAQLVEIYMLHDFVAGSPPSVATFSDRLIAQKVGYLATAAFGLPLGPYRFSWNVRGPYSRAYASALRTLHSRRAAVAAEAAKYTLSALALGRLSKFRVLIQHRPSGCELEAWLETLASAHYLSIRTQARDKAKLTESMRLHKPNISEIIAKAAISELIFIGAIRATSAAAQ